MKVGLYRPKTLWPFPSEDMRKNVGDRPVLVVEMSKGQLIWPVERFLRKKVSHLAEYFGSIPPPTMILRKIILTMEELM